MKLTHWDNENDIKRYLLELLDKSIKKRKKSVEIDRLIRTHIITSFIKDETIDRWIFGK